MTESIAEQSRAIPISSGRMVRFAANMPLEIALLCTDGVRIERRYGDRVKYTLTDERTMYVDPFVADRIKELAIQPGELFQICKRQAKIGNRKTIYWAVEQSGEPSSQLERDLRESLDMARSRGTESQSIPNPDLTPSAAPVPPVPPPNAFYELEASSLSPEASNGKHGATDSGRISASPAPHVATDGTPALPCTQLAHALKTAISAAADAEKFAKTLDYNIRFTTDDIRSMGITVLIGMQQRMPR
jgi:hypothetical protein